MTPRVRGHYGCQMSDMKLLESFNMHEGIFEWESLLAA